MAMMMGKSEWIKEYFMLGFNFVPYQKFVWRGMVLVKWRVWLASVLVHRNKKPRT